ncbi:MAG: protein translocase subunit SecD [Campylobacter sp.]|nr:protein translocase subunit SecD [Campylobacter sp.]
MRKANVTYRLIIFLIAILFGVGFSMPSFLQTQSGSKISLGLDLQGGLYMLLGVENEAAVASKIKSIAASINYYSKKEDILIDKLKAKDEVINFDLIDSDDSAKIDKMLSEITGLNIQKNGLSYRIELSEQERKATLDYAVLQAVETIRNRLDQFGLAEPTVAKQGEDNILVELPGIKTQEDEQRARDLIAKAAHLQLMAVDEKRQDQVYTLNTAEAESYGDVIYEDVKNEKIKYLLKDVPILDGSMLTDAKVAFSQQTNQPVINFTLNSEGAKIFGDFTGENVGNRLAIVLDGKVYSAPNINERIGGGSGQISGAFSVDEAHNIAIALRSGALLAPVKMLEKRSIGPSLGAESIQKSMTALAGASVLVVLFMLVYYGFSGILANIALVANIFILIAVMALFGATLTLPGMAGIVLTVGMAVDANVIINERIREALREGLSLKASIVKGYENAMSAIIDANVTTLITVVALYAYGTGPVKGFAVTMSIGVLASMLTAILGTRGCFDYLANKIEKNKSTSFWFGYKRG